MKKVFFLVFSVITAQAQSISFEAKGLLFLNDGDFNPYSFGTGIVKKDKFASDKIGSFVFPLALDEEGNEQVLSNSALDAYKNIAIKSDHRICYVLESHNSFKKDASGQEFNLKSTPDGNFVSVVDITNLRNVKPGYRFQVAPNPKALALSKDNKYLAVAAEGYNQELQVFELDETGKPVRLIQRPVALGNGTISDVVWHPTEDFLVFLKKETREIGLVKVLRDGPTGNIIRLELVGNTIKMEGNLKTGEFTKDGKYFLVLDSRDEPGTNSLGQKGQVFVVRFALEDNGSHALISKAEVEENPSAMVIHPSGRFILVTNQKKSFEYPFSKNTGKGSLSVLWLQPEGTLQNKINVPLDGVMPSGLVFDKNGNNLAVSFMQFLNFGKSTGGIQFFSFTGGNSPKVEKQSSMINTSKGIHSLRVIEDF
ncbi:MAG: hypothetical protein U0V04_07880 [Spirosomataceae bacterium]